MARLVPSDEPDWLRDYIAEGTSPRAAAPPADEPAWLRDYIDAGVNESALPSSASPTAVDRPQYRAQIGQAQLEPLTPRADDAGRAAPPDPRMLAILEQQRAEDRATDQPNQVSGPGITISPTPEVAQSYAARRARLNQPAAPGRMGRLRNAMNGTPPAALWTAPPPEFSYAAADDPALAEPPPPPPTQDPVAVTESPAPADEPPPDVEQATDDERAPVAYGSLKQAQATDDSGPLRSKWARLAIALASAGDKDLDASLDAEERAHQAQKIQRNAQSLRAEQIGQGDQRIAQAGRRLGQGDTRIANQDAQAHARIKTAALNANTQRMNADPESSFNVGRREYANSEYDRRAGETNAEWEHRRAAGEQEDIRGEDRNREDKLARARAAGGMNPYPAQRDPNAVLTQDPTNRGEALAAVMRTQFPDASPERINAMVQFAATLPAKEQVQLFGMQMHHAATAETARDTARRQMTVPGWERDDVSGPLMSDAETREVRSAESAIAKLEGMSRRMGEIREQLSTADRAGAALGIENELTAEAATIASEAGAQVRLLRAFGTPTGGELAIIDRDLPKVGTLNELISGGPRWNQLARTARNVFDSGMGARGYRRPGTAAGATPSASVRRYGTEGGGTAVTRPGEARPAQRRETDRLVDPSTGDALVTYDDGTEEVINGGR